MAKKDHIPCDEVLQFSQEPQAGLRQHLASPDDDSTGAFGFILVRMPSTAASWEQTRAIGQGPEQVDTVVGARPIAHAIAQAVILIDFMVQAHVRERPRVPPSWREYPIKPATLIGSSFGMNCW